MPEAKRVAEPFFYELDVDRYLRRVGLGFSEVERHLFVSNPQLTLWRSTQRLPVAVWNRAVSLWGDQQMKPLEAKKVDMKPFMLNPIYGEKQPPLAARRLASEISPILATVPAEADRPKPSPSVVREAPVAQRGNDVYLAVIDTLVRHVASVTAEKALLAKEVFRLQRTIHLLQENGEMESDLTALDAVVGTTPAPETTIAPIRAVLKETVADAGLLKQIEERLPFLIAR